ncbi:MAG: 4'-phosphopantetheinyl transferase superfamily protein [Bacteroidia bacterium]|nr:4'-phosphopantetheinyl transferase superfamily protein [Bacteroidia bacterium]
MLQIRQINDAIKVGVLALNDFSQQQGIINKRELEQAGAIYLLSQMLNTTQFEIHYTAHRKPYLKNRSEHISISHSHDKLAIIINSKENTGIDIELIREKIKQIEHKFLSAEERQMAGANTSTLIQFWAAKETLYKVYGLKELEFIENLYIESFNQQQLIAGIKVNNTNKKYLLVSELIDNYQLVYPLNEI